MRSAKSSQSSTSSTSSIADSSDSCSSGQDDYADSDVMCLVYPDGRTTTVTAQSSSS